jgi:hypothetical protein
VTINPPEAPVHVRQTQTFEAVVKGTHSTGIRWAAVEERNGGRITEDGIYTASRHVAFITSLRLARKTPLQKLSPK